MGANMNQFMTAITEAEAKAQGYTVVKSALELQNALNAGENVMLFADIDMNDIVGGWQTVSSYEGKLDGNGFTISNVTSALIGTANGAEIQNLNLKDVNIYNSSTANTGAIAQTATNTTFENIEVSGSVMSDHSGSNTGLVVGSTTNSTFKNIELSGIASCPNNTGALAGLATGVVVENITSYATVSGDNNTGGIIGFVNNSETITTKLSNIIQKGNVVSYGTSANSTGGIIGSTDTANIIIENCEVTGNVTAEGNNVGGIAGDFVGEINNCVVTGNVLGSNNVGGILGIASSTTITHSYVTGDVTGVECVGGAVGGMPSVINGIITIDKFYATGTIKGSMAVGGIAGEYNGDLTNSFFAGNVIAEENHRGFIGALIGCDSGIDRTIANCAFRDQSNNGSAFATENTSGINGVFADYSNINFMKSADWFNNKENLKSILDPEDKDIWNFNTIQNADHTSKYDELVGVNLITEAEAIKQGYTVVRTQTELMQALDFGQNIMLFGDIELTGTWGALETYAGTFDGNGFTISNLNGTQGLFKTLTGTVQNLNLKDVNIDNVGGGGDIGAVAGTINGGKVSNVTVMGYINGSQTANAGAIAGAMTSGEITNCTYQFGVQLKDDATDDTKAENWKATGSIRGGYTGGIVGSMSGGAIVGAQVKAGVVTIEGKAIECIGSIDGSDSAGGIVGSVENGKIIGSSANAEVSSLHDAAGGIAGSLYTTGENKITIVGCSSKGKIYDGINECGAGGVAGYIFGTRTVDENGNYNYSITISDCFSTADIEGSNAGGFAGYVSGALIENSYALGAVKGLINAGGFAGYAGNGATIRNSYATGDISGDNTSGGYGGFVGCISSDSAENVVNIYNVFTTSQVKATAGIRGAFVGNIETGSYVSFNTPENIAAGNAANYAYAIQQNTLGDTSGLGIKIGSGGAVVNFVGGEKPYNDNVLGDGSRDANWFSDVNNLSGILNSTVNENGEVVLLEGDDAHWTFGYEIFDSTTGENKILTLNHPALSGNVTGSAELTPAEKVTIEEALGDSKTYSTYFTTQVLPDGEPDKDISFDTSFSLKVNVDVDIDLDNDGVVDISKNGIFGEDITLDVITGNSIKAIKAENLAILEDLRNAILGKQSYIDEKQAELATKQDRLIQLLTGGKVGSGSSNTSVSGTMKQTHTTAVNKQEFNNAVSDLVQALMEVIQGSLLSSGGGSADFYNILNLMGFPTNLLSGTSSSLSSSSWSGGSGLSSKK